MAEYTLAGFQWLLKVSGQASILAVLVLAIQWLTQGHMAAKWRYSLWFLVIVRLILPFSFQSPLSIYNIGAYNSMLNRESTNKEGSQPIPPFAEEHSFSTVDDVANPETDNNKNLLAAQPLPPETESVHKNSVHSAINPLTILQLLWLIGVVFLVIRVVIQNFRFSKKLKQCSYVDRPEILENLSACQNHMDVSGNIGVIETNLVQSPALYGLVRRAILLPPGIISSFSIQELRYVFMHELAHVKRKDMAVNWIIVNLQILHWFNPFIWLVFRRMESDRELACDALALSHTTEKENQEYGCTIIRLLERFACPRSLSGLVGILEDKQQVKRRIAMIAKFNRKGHGFALAALVFLSLGFITLTEATTDTRLFVTSRRGSDDSKHNLEIFRKAMVYSCGDGSSNSIDPSKGEEILTKLSEAGYPPAKMWLAHCYHWGEDTIVELSVKGFRQNMALGLCLAQESFGPLESIASSSRIPDAQFLVGIYYATFREERDYSEAFDWYLKAASQGYAPAQYFVGNCCGRGEGTNQNPAEEIKWHRKAAEQGFAPAQEEMGDYYSGKKDYMESLKWYKSAAEQGSASAHTSIAVHYLDVEKDTSEGMKWLKKAVELEDEYAKFNLEKHTKPPTVIFEDVPQWVDENVLGAVYATMNPALVGHGSDLSESVVRVIQEVLEPLAYLDQVRVRGGRGSFAVQAKWRKPLVIIKKGLTRFYVDADLMVLGDLSWNLPLVLVQGVSLDVTPRPGTQVQAQDLAEALKLIHYMDLMDRDLTPNKPLLRQIDSIDMTNHLGRRNRSDSHINLIARDGTTILWGAEMGQSDEHMELSDAKKAARLYTFYKDCGYQLMGKAKYINLRGSRTMVPTPATGH